MISPSRIHTDPGSIPGHGTNFSGRGYWHTLVIQLLGGPEVDSTVRGVLSFFSTEILAMGG